MPERPSARRVLGGTQRVRCDSSSHSRRTDAQVARTTSRYKVSMAKSVAAVTEGVGEELRARFKVLGALSVSHFLNDMMQSLIVSLYPLLKSEFSLSFAEVGVITLT